MSFDTCHDVDAFQAHLFAHDALEMAIENALTANHGTAAKRILFSVIDSNNHKGI